MTEANGAAPAPQPAQPPQIRMHVLGQYIRDMSFENAVAQRGVQASDVQPDTQVAVSLDARKRSADHQFEVITKYRVTSKNKVNGETLFLIELDYAGVFHVEGVAEDQLHPFLLIECPRMTFPFVRRILSDVTRDGGFPALNIETVDFLSLYRQELQRRVDAQKAAQPVS
jgi:preprotein translocase subunit SecB